MHYVTCRTGAIEHNWITLSYIHVCICIHWMPSHDFWQQYSAQLHTLWTVPLKSEQRGNVWGPCWAGNITPILTTQQSSKTNRFWFPAEDLILNCRVKINFYWPHNHSMLQYDIHMQYEFIWHMNSFSSVVLQKPQTSTTSHNQTTPQNSTSGNHFYTATLPAASESITTFWLLFECRLLVSQGRWLFWAHPDVLWLPVRMATPTPLGSLGQCSVILTIKTCFYNVTVKQQPAM